MADGRTERGPNRPGARPERGGRRRSALARLLGAAALMPIATRAPQYARLALALVRDERVPAARKGALAAAAGYLLVGRDLVPDRIPLLGGLDDLVVALLAVELFLDGIPAPVLAEHVEAAGLDGRVVAADVARIRRVVPGPLRRTVRALPGLVAAAGATLRDSGPGRRARGLVDTEGSNA